MFRGTKTFIMNSNDISKKWNEYVLCIIVVPLIMRMTIITINFVWEMKWNLFIFSQKEK